MNVDEQTLRKVVRTEVNSAVNAAVGPAVDTAVSSALNTSVNQAVGPAVKTAFEVNLAGLVGQITSHLDKRLTVFEKKIDSRVNDIFNLVDGFTKRLDDDDAEYAALSNKVDRHGRWIGELADKTNTQLSPP